MSELVDRFWFYWLSIKCCWWLAIVGFRSLVVLMINSCCCRLFVVGCIDDQPIVVVGSLLILINPMLLFIVYCWLCLNVVGCIDHQSSVVSSLRCWFLIISYTNDQSNVVVAWPFLVVLMIVDAVVTLGDWQPHDPKDIKEIWCGLSCKGDGGDTIFWWLVLHFMVLVGFLGWCGVFWRGHHTWAYAIWAVGLLLSSTSCLDLSHWNWRLSIPIVHHSLGTRVWTNGN